MEKIIVAIIAGIVLIVVGILNTKGNLSTIHRYHIKRVTPENALPFGRLVGLGTIIIGASLILLGVFTLISVLAKSRTFEIVGLIIFGVGLLVGIGFSFYAMIKYNKGLF